MKFRSKLKTHTFLRHVDNLNEVHLSFPLVYKYLCLQNLMIYNILIFFFCFTLFCVFIWTLVLSDFLHGDILDVTFFLLDLVFQGGLIEVLNVPIGAKDGGCKFPILLYSKILYCSFWVFIV